MKITTSYAAGGFEFRRCTQCGTNSWSGPDGPVSLDRVLKALSHSRPRGLWRYAVSPAIFSTGSAAILRNR